MSIVYNGKKIDLEQNARSDAEFNIAHDGKIYALMNMLKKLNNTNDFSLHKKETEISILDLLRQRGFGKIDSLSAVILSTNIDNPESQLRLNVTYNSGNQGDYTIFVSKDNLRVTNIY